MAILNENGRVIVHADTDETGALTSRGHLRITDEQGEGTQDDTGALRVVYIEADPEDHIGLYADDGRTRVVEDGAEGLDDLPGAYNSFGHLVVDTYAQI